MPCRNGQTTGKISGVSQGGAAVHARPSWQTGETGTREITTFHWDSLQRVGTPAYGKEGKRYAVGGTMKDATTDETRTIELSTECDEFTDY